MRRSFAHLQLFTYRLKAESDSLALFLLPRGVDFQLLNFLVLSKKLIEQHRVHRFVANGLEFAILIAFHQIRSRLSDFLSHKTKLSERNDFSRRFVPIT